MKNLFDRLFILEIANNHMGDVSHGIEIIREFKKICGKFPFKFAFKFQYRDLDTFIHPQYKNRLDIKYVKRFTETRLNDSDFLELKKEAEKCGFITVCTPFDEASVEKVIEHKYDILKIASCSFTDWPLLEKIAETDIPLIASTAGAALEDIDKIVSFFEHRNKTFCLMHCVGAYPTPDNQLELNQLDFFRNRYPNIAVGYSTHENPDNLTAVMVAVAKGAAVFERHVGLPTEKYSLNAYSSSPDQLKKWLEAAESAYSMCGVSGRRRSISEKEKADMLGLKRGVFAKRKIASSEKISVNDIFFAIPNTEGQLLTDDISKYTEISAQKEIDWNSPLMTDDLNIKNIRDKVLNIVKSISELLKKSGVRLKNKLELEISHHYGIDKFETYGCAMINCINREYCKKIILLLPGQLNPTHYHKKKEETFHILYGDVELEINGERRKYTAGDLIIVERGVKHNFSSETGAVFEEVSTTHYKNDSFYDDERIMKCPCRKTEMTFWSDWLFEEIK